MDIDFHYYMIKALSQSAGFTASEAQDIAYANQFVDDSWEVIPAVIDDMPGLELGALRLRPNVFNPVTTAHNDDTVIGGFMTAAQLRTYIAFHFIPDAAYGGSGDYDYCTVPNGALAREIVARAIKRVQESANDPEQRTRSVIKLGIATHSYMDTWAHQRFSGRFSEADNMVQSIEEFENGQWVAKRASDTNSKLNLFATPIGHARAGFRPDMSQLRWRYRSPTGMVERDNASIFMEAARALFKVFAEAAGTGAVWSDALEAKVAACIAYRPDDLGEANYSTKKPEIYPRTFPGITFSYDRNAWRKVLEGDLAGFATTDGPTIAAAELAFAADAANPTHGLPKLKYKADHSVGLRWFYFHLEALDQRLFVVSKVKPLPPSHPDGVVASALTNVKHIFEINLPAELEQALKTSNNPVVQGLWNGYRSLLPVPTHIRDKHRWIQVTVENNTQFDVIWTRMMSGDGSSGRFWHGQEPQSIPALNKMTFLACNSDDSVGTGISLAGVFKIYLGQGVAVPFTLAFTHPQADTFWDVVKSAFAQSDPPRKCWAQFADSADHARNVVDNGGRHETTNMRLADGTSLRLDLHSMPGPHARVIITEGDGCFEATLRASNGHYVCAEGTKGRELNANRAVASDWEKFQIVALGGDKVAIRTWSGHYWCAEGGGGGVVVANRSLVDSWETFVMHTVEPGVVAFQAHNGQYVCAEGGGGREVRADKGAIGVWERFILTRL